MDDLSSTVLSRISSLDPENASRIMGFILLQYKAETELLRLASAPEALLLSYINRAKACLGIPLNNPSSEPQTPVPNHMGQTNPFSHTPPRILIPNSGLPVSYAAALNGSNASGSGPPSLKFYGANEMVDPIRSPSGRSDSLILPYCEDANGVRSPVTNPLHRRSFSVNDAAFLSNLEEAGGFGWKPCVYFARGFCKNGGNCKFSHTDGNCGESIEAGSLSENCSGFDELMKIKALQQQKLALMGSGSQYPFAYNKGMNFLNENQRFAAASLIMDDFSPMGFSDLNSCSRQIYLTFPSDSMFNEDDVRGYFSMFGPVHDVRIPYQQKRMFGFVTFFYPETVRAVLVKGNPHFVCNSRVLVKPYKEKGKVIEKSPRQQLAERGEYAACLSPPAGSRMFLSREEMMLRRKIDQDMELQHAMELQGRRMMNLQLMDVKNQNRFPPRFYSPRQQSQFMINQNVALSSDLVNQKVSEEFGGVLEAFKSRSDDEKLVPEGTESLANASDLPESLEHILPDNFFSSPTKLAAENHYVFSHGDSTDSHNLTSLTSTSSNNTPFPTSSSPLGMASIQPCYFQIPRFSSGKEAIDM